MKDSKVANSSAFKHLVLGISGLQGTNAFPVANEVSWGILQEGQPRFGPWSDFIRVGNTVEGAGFVTRVVVAVMTLDDSVRAFDVSAKFVSLTLSSLLEPAKAGLLVNGILVGLAEAAMDVEIAPDPHVSCPTNFFIGVDCIKKLFPWIPNTDHINGNWANLVARLLEPYSLRRGPVGMREEVLKLLAGGEYRGDSFCLRRMIACQLAKRCAGPHDLGRFIDQVLAP